MVWPDDEDPTVTDAVERAIDATDERTDTHWRHRARGGTLAAVVGGVDTRRTSVHLHLPEREMEILVRCAKVRGLSPVRYVRQCVATSIVEEHGYDPADVPWMTRDGLLP